MSLISMIKSKLIFGNLDLDNPIVAVVALRDNFERKEIICKSEVSTYDPSTKILEIYSVVSPEQALLVTKEIQFLSKSNDIDDLDRVSRLSSMMEDYFYEEMSND